MPAGEAFSLQQSVAIERALSSAESSSGLHYSVYVGPLGESPRSRAQTLHAAAAADPSDLVLIALDLVARRLEIVTGDTAADALDDRSCGLAALSMTTALQAGDLMGAIVDGLGVLAEHARHPRVLHVDQP